MNTEEFEKPKELGGWSEIRSKFDSADSKEEMLGLSHNMSRTSLSGEEKVKRANYYLRLARNYPDKEVKAKIRKDLFGVILDYPEYIISYWWMNQNKAWSFIEELLTFLESESEGVLKELVQKEPFSTNLKELLGDLYSSARFLRNCGGTSLSGPVNKWDTKTREELVKKFPLVIRVLVKYRLYSEWMIYFNHPIFLDAMKRDLFGHSGSYSRKELKTALLEGDPSFVQDFLEMEKNLKD